MASRNIRFLQESNSLTEFRKILVHSDHLRNLAAKLKYWDIHKMLSDAVWSSITTSGDKERYGVLEHNKSL